MAHYDIYIYIYKTTRVLPETELNTNSGVFLYFTAPLISRLCPPFDFSML